MNKVLIFVPFLIKPYYLPCRI